MADIRELMEEAFDEIALDDRESIKSFVREAFTLEKTKELWVPVTCKHCARVGKYPVTIGIPDYKERAKAIESMLNQAKGKPKETVKVQVDVGVRQLAEMSLDDLAAEERAILTAHPELAEKT